MHMVHKIINMKLCQIIQNKLNKATQFKDTNNLDIYDLLSKFKTL